MIKEGKVPYRVFVIAGSEPLGSAGIQADVKAISACGGYAAGAIICVVDEDTEHVKDVCLIPVDMVVFQIQSFMEDVGADCIKTGMLYSKDLVLKVSETIKNYAGIPLVVDPVMVSSSGDQLLEDEAIFCYKKKLMPLATIITPNMREAEILLVVMMFAQYAVGKGAVSQQFDGTVEVFFQPFGGDARVGVIVQCLVDTGDGFHLLQDGTYVVAHQNDGTLLVDFGQQLIEACLETLVDVGAGFVEYYYRGIGNDGSAQ